MLYFSNPTAEALDHMTAGTFGCVVTPGQGGHLERAALDGGAPWFADNGCYGGGFHGYGAWWLWLESYMAFARTCAFAVAPDVPFDHGLTVQRSLRWLGAIRDLGFPPAFCLQNGATMSDRLPWEMFDVLFIAGSMDFKHSTVATHFTREAKQRGKKVHWGRANSMLRIRQAHGAGMDTADGGYFRHGPAINLQRALGWVAELNRNGAQTFI